MAMSMCHDIVSVMRGFKARLCHSGSCGEVDICQLKMVFNCSGAMYTVLVFLQQHSFYATLIGFVHIVCHPVFTQQVFGHLNHDVVRRGARIIVVT